MGLGERGHGEVRKELGGVEEGQIVIEKYCMREDSIISLKFIHSESLMASWCQSSISCDTDSLYQVKLTSKVELLSHFVL